MHKVNTRWGELEVRYARTEYGNEYLLVPSSTHVVRSEWNGGPKSLPPRDLSPRDLTVTADWDKHLTLALAADVEDGKFAYRPPTKPQPKKP